MPTAEVRKFRDIGAVIKAVRESQNTRQENLAETPGFSNDYLSPMENGKPNLYITRLFRTLNLLHIKVRVTYTLGPENNPRC